MVSLILIHLKLGIYLLDKNSGPGIFICIYCLDLLRKSFVLTESFLKGCPELFTFLNLRRFVI